MVLKYEIDHTYSAPLTGKPRKKCFTIRNIGFNNNKILYVVKERRLDFISISADDILS